MTISIYVYTIYGGHGPGVQECIPSHSPPQDFCKSEKKNETGMHRTNMNMTKTRPDDSHKSDIKFIEKILTVEKYLIKTGMYRL